MKFQTVSSVLVVTAVLSACSSSSGDGGAPPIVESKPPTVEGEPPPVKGEPPTGPSEPPPTEGEPPTAPSEPPPIEGEPPTGEGEPPPIEGEPPTVVGASFDDALALVAAFGIDGENLQALSVDALPDHAQMSGYMALGTDDSRSVIIGDATAEVNFSMGFLFGTADNFAEYLEAEACEESIELCTGTARQDVDGFLGIDGDITGTSFTFNTSGLLFLDDLDGDGAEMVVDVDVDGEGEFSTYDGKLAAVGGADTVLSRPGETETSDGFVGIWLVD